MEESRSPYSNIADVVRDLADLAALQALMSASANLTQADEDAIDSITIRLLAWAESRGDPQAVDRFGRLRQALRKRFSTG